MSKPKRKYYVVWKGRHPGVYDDWRMCQKEIIGFNGALFKGFPDLESANSAYRIGYEPFKETMPVNGIALSEDKEKPLEPSVAVDAACSGNPGRMEYRCVVVATGQELFRSPVFRQGTNNIGEFLAIVHALAWQKKNGWSLPVYSDSVNAQLWVRQKKCKTKLQPNAENEHLFQLIARAENWLNANPVEVPVLKWRTEMWGEIPADFGRK